VLSCELPTSEGIEIPLKEVKNMSVFGADGGGQERQSSISSEVPGPRLNSLGFSDFSYLYLRLS